MKQKIIPDMTIFSRGDCVTFELRLGDGDKGAAFLRTNLGNAVTRRRELISHTESGAAVLSRDWHDLPMRQTGKNRWSITLPLLEIGFFEAKVFLMPHGSADPEWPPGDNMRLKVEPPENICGNTIYTVFPRQFGPNIAAKQPAQEKAAIEALEKKNYTVIPPSGTFRDVIRRLNFIIDKLNSRIIQLLPIHPIPTTFGKMGQFGSPFASLDYYAVDPALAEFDHKTTPLEQFIELIDAVHARHGRIFLDIPVNHTGWASRLHVEHPEWFERREDRSFISPGAWGVVWADLCKLDYRKQEVHKLMADVFLYWSRKGVDGFRCDAGYMLPAAAWQYIVAKVRNEYPQTVFLLEGLGGPLDVQEKLLSDCGLNWAYSEIFQTYNREQFEHYLSYMNRISLDKGLLINFAETHDNNRLAATSAVYARMRTALCALTAHNGGFGITNGVEWLASEKIDVHDAASLNWGCRKNQVMAVRRLQTLLEINPAFHAGAKISLIEEGHDNILALLRTSLDRKHSLLILVNLDCEKTVTAKWRTDSFAAEPAIDLLTGDEYDVSRNQLPLEPGRILCLSPVREELEQLEQELASPRDEPLPALENRYRAAAMDIYVACRRHYGDIGELDIAGMSSKLAADPVAFCAEICNCELPPLVIWNNGVDQRRNVMLPPHTMLLLKGHNPFRAEIIQHGKTRRCGLSLPCESHEHFLIFYGLNHEVVSKIEFCKLQIKSYNNGNTQYSSGKLLLLPEPENVSFRMSFAEREVEDKQLYALCSNALGGMSQVSAAWGTLNSKYDAILAANCNSHFPIDRQVMFTRCRAWLVCRDYSREINLACLDRFTGGPDNLARWEFQIPAGQGSVAQLHITLQMAENGNAVRLTFHRPLRDLDIASQLVENEPVKIILRPDIEDRCNHEITRACNGPEKIFSAATTTQADGFYFNPSGERGLNLQLPGGKFVPQPEWLYMVALPMERERGQEDHTDVFSPGYFEFQLKGGETRNLLAAVTPGTDAPPEYSWPKNTLHEEVAPESALYHAMKRFIVKRNQFKTIIAGYPWFLDWGRDTLICLRGMIAAGYLRESRDIILQFARFEQQGTIPNMIRGKDDSNRDTSDAPLWLFTAVKDFIDISGEDSILQDNCGGRNLFSVLESIIHSYCSGTPNGIVLDVDSGLVFSPAHFTWMDTNYPAGTPRQGYPVEIQALWFAALDLMNRRGGQYNDLLEQVRESIAKLYPLAPGNGLSDCLHAPPGKPAASAVPDDALRPNQLFAVTLRAVDNPLRQGIVSSCECLLIPGAIRSLADRAVKYSLPIYRNGVLLNDPGKPYWGVYAGDEDVRRKPAYHNGAAWSWPFPSYCEALYLVGGEDCRRRALALLLSCQHVIENGTPGQVPEIFDGNAPHQWRGCGAQAWGITELYRVLKLLSEEKWRDR